MQLLAALTAVVFSPCRPDEAAALRKLYQQTFDTHKNSAGNYDRGWKRYAEWNSGDPCGDGTLNGVWEGVKCTGCPSCRITELQLTDNRLSGKFTAAMFTPLTELRVLRLRKNNGVTGTFPTGVLPLLTKLEELTLGDSLTGPLPDWTNSKNTLKVVHMYGPFSGNLPPSYLDLPNAVEIQFWNTKLTGQVPPFNLMPNVEQIYFSSNRQLSKSPIPDLSNNPKLKQLTLYYSNFEGDVPSFANQNLLEHLDLRINYLTGELPDFPSFNILKKCLVGRNYIRTLPMHRLPQVGLVFWSLQELTAEENLLRGTLPCHLDVYPNITILTLSSNFMTGTLPCLDNLAKMKSYRVNGNDFTGTLPNTTVGDFVNTFDITENRIRGSIPATFVNALTDAEYIRMGENMFTGTLPNLTLPKLREFHAHRNGEWVQQVPVVTHPDGGVASSFTNSAMDNNPSTMYECRQGSDPCRYFVFDFGQEILIDVVTILRPDETPSGSEARTSNGSVVDLRLYHSSKGNSYKDVGHPLSYVWVKGDWSRNIPGSKLIFARNDWYTDKFTKWRSYSNTPTRYYRLDFRYCQSTDSGSCKIPEVKFYTTNRLTGTIPDLANVPELRSLHLYGNDLIGTIPNLQKADSWDGGELRLEDNHLENGDPICPNLAKIKLVDISNNELTGELPNLSCMSVVETIGMAGNTYSGTISPGLKSDKLKALYLNDNGCCLGYKWLREYLRTNSGISGRDTPVCERCSEFGIGGILPNWSSIPNVQWMDFDNNQLTGVIEDNMVELTNIEWFKIRRNFLVGTLPVYQMSEIGSVKETCTHNSWYFSDNYLYGETVNTSVSQFPFDTRKCTAGGQAYNCRCGRFNHYNDGRKIYDTLFDDNFLHGTIPEQIARTQGYAAVIENCWSCPLNPMPSYTTNCALTNETCLNPPARASLTRDYEIPKPFYRGDPDCSGGRNISDIQRCQSSLKILNISLPESAVRSGEEFFINIKEKVLSTDKKVLPYFGPGIVFTPDTGLPRSPYGYGTVNFTDSLKNEIYDSIYALDTQNRFSYNPQKTTIMQALDIDFAYLNPYVNLPTTVVVKFTDNDVYDIFRNETLEISIPDEMLLTPFGYIGGMSTVYLDIYPEPGTIHITPGKMIIPEREIREGIEVEASLDEGETFNCDPRCGFSIVSQGVTGNITNPRTGRGGHRQCGWDCLAVRNLVQTTFNCSSDPLGTLLLDIRTPDYHIPSGQQETIIVSFNEGCIKSGLPVQGNATVNVTIIGEDMPTETETMTLHSTRTETATLTQTATFTVSASASESASFTETGPPLCSYFGSRFQHSIFCTESEEGSASSFFIFPIFLCLLISLLAYVLTGTPKPPQIDCNVQDLDIAVDDLPEEPLHPLVVPAPVVDNTITVTARHVKPAPLESDEITVRARLPYDSDAITVTARHPTFLRTSYSSYSSQAIDSSPSSTFLL